MVSIDQGGMIWVIGYILGTVAVVLVVGIGWYFESFKSIQK
jgi:hypothetical protein